MKPVPPMTRICTVEAYNHYSEAMPANGCELSGTGSLLAMNAAHIRHPLQRAVRRRFLPLDCLPARRPPLS